MNYYLIREDILPEAILKTVQAKELLAKGQVKTIHEAVEKVDLSRSAFYRYKDGIHVLSTMARDQIVTIGMDLEHRSGTLSKVLATIASHNGNVLTINQTIPLQGWANVTLSVEASLIGEQIYELIDAIVSTDGVRQAKIIGQGGAI
ncbi:ACT domain-containing protein [Paenibacillus albiflavus]|uniref:UPF0735 ACT domain-containing protein E0485_18455 n=1 Tax=Paenibacillus albiflavus TaxID=2545760 RepID=A0A4R4E8M8_9BACL|nr:ACT domain-containing protein [Paenibacillus albiflavus]TCZ75210.1 ACT domain-containing protein [Paenibacillus albiflavus]